MAVFFLRRSKGAGAVAVTITGTGSSTTCYAVIDGTTYTAAASGIEVKVGDTIILAVKGNGSGAQGKITIDGTVVATTTSSLKTYEYTVQKGTGSIAIALNASTLLGRGQITVTTS